MGVLRTPCEGNLKEFTMIKMTSTTGAVVIQIPEYSQASTDIEYLKINYVPAPGASHTAKVTLGMVGDTSKRLYVSKYMLVTTVGDLQRAQTKLALGAQAFSKVELRRI